jgi:DNA recombination protein RmuC
MDTTGLLLGALLLIAGIVIGVLLGRAYRRDHRSGDRLDALLAPASDAMQRVEQHLHDVERDRAAAYAGLREQVSALYRTSADLNQHTRALAGALSAPQVRGRWGEMQLQRVVELAGMLEHCDFETQVGVRSDDPETAGVRPDMIIRLSGGRQIPVDAKVPFASYLEAMDCADERRRAALLAGHARALRGHVDALAAKAYWRHFQPAPEFVVLFVPGEPLLDAALAVDPGLADHAFARNVVMATPTSLIALLRTVAYVWRQDRLSASAAQVHALGRDLHRRLGTLAAHLSTLGISLDRAVRSYNGTVRSLESRVLVSARKLADLGVTGEDLQSPVQVDTAPLVPQEPAAGHPPDQLGSPMDRAAAAAAEAAVHMEAAESTYVARARGPSGRARDATVDG